MESLQPSRFQIISRHIAIAGMFIAIAGLVISRAAMSVAPVIILLGALGSAPLKVQFRRFAQNRAAWLISLFIVIHLISWFVTFDKKGWLEELEIKLPLLVILYGLSVIAPFSLREVKAAIGILVLAVFFTGTVSFIHYLMNKAVIDEAITRSKPITILFGIHHIYFSIVMGFSILAGYWFVMEKKIALHKVEKWLIGGVCLINFGYMHVLTTRTGLVACYMAILILGLVFLVRNKRYVHALILVTLLGSAPVVGYYALPSFQYRVDNTWFDVSRYFEGKDPNYLSIGTRLESWKTAWNLSKESPVMGTGTADIMQDMYYQYVVDNSALCPENQVEPHNQFIHLLVGNGWVGLIVFSFAWFYPLFSKKVKKPFLFQAFWLIYFLAMLGEATLERQEGIMFLALFWEITRSESLQKD